MIKNRLAAIALTASVLGSSVLAGSSAYAAETIQGQVTEVRTSTEVIAEWESWTRDHANKLDTIQPADINAGGEQFKDLEMLKPLLKDKRIVFLGESSHGVSEFNLAKTRLIQFLHQEMGYNVLAFESGLGNASLAYGQSGSQSAEQTMKNSVFGVWWTQETLPLFEYIKSTQTTEDPLILTGFDMQFQYPHLNGSWLEDEKLAQRLQEVEKKMIEYSLGIDLKAYQQEKAPLIQVYEDVLKAVQTEASHAHLMELYPDNPKLPVLLERTLLNRIDVAKEYVELCINMNIGMAEGEYTWFLKTMEWRDQVMLDNLMWLANDVYPKEKFIVWGHNDHVRKAHSEVIGTPYPVKFMGEMLPEEMKEQSYVLGLYPASGTMADNSGQIYDILPLQPGSIESILSASGSPYTFIDLRYQIKDQGNSWMFEPRYTYSWGTLPENLIARDQYDGILLIDNVTPPEYIRLSSSKAME
nr:erythromycin esterase family protein [Paenibacillus faecalis]